MWKLPVNEANDRGFRTGQSLCGVDKVLALYKLNECVTLYRLTQRFLIKLMFFDIWYFGNNTVDFLTNSVVVMTFFMNTSRTNINTDNEGMC